MSFNINKVGECGKGGIRKDVSLTSQVILAALIANSVFRVQWSPLCLPTSLLTPPPNFHAGCICLGYILPQLSKLCPFFNGKAAPSSSDSCFLYTAVLVMPLLHTSRCGLYFLACALSVIL